MFIKLAVYKNVSENILALKIPVKLIIVQTEPQGFTAGQDVG